MKLCWLAVLFVILIAPFGIHYAFAQSVEQPPAETSAGGSDAGSGTGVPGGTTQETPSTTSATAMPAATSSSGGVVVPGTRTTTTPTANPSPKPNVPAVVPATTTASDTATTSAANTPSNDPGNSNNTIFFALVSLAVAATLGAYGIARAVQKRNEQQEQHDENKCDSIQSLLEQKKEELVAMIKELPEETALALLKKNEKIGAAIEVAENIKGKYEKLQQAIEVLERRYDLCKLSLPEAGGASYHGTIIENSLNDKEVLKNLKILKTYRSGDWILHDVEVNEKQIEKLGQTLNEGPWYMHFWNADSDDLIAVFKEKNFKMKNSDKETWRDAVDYGIKKEIPKEQLDFKTRR